ncbi:MAG: VWA domain-containing protein [Chloroflexi bacterium]|nr:VWA domain-containing protein [Chloroflexota bacterium]
MAGELQLRISVNKQQVPVTRTQQLIYVLVSAQPSQVIARTRMGLNFGFVLDRSGSMRGSKIERLKEAVSLAVSRMNPEDRLSVTVFNDSAQVLAASGTLGEQRTLASRVRDLRAGGGTQMARGLSLGLREVFRHYDEQRSNQVLLLTDGQTYGDESQCLKLAREAGEHHIAIQALGLGDDWNEDLLDQVGQLSGGDSDLVESADEIVPLFAQTVERSQKAIVRNARLTLRLVPGVVPRQVWQVTPLLANLGYMPIGEHDVQIDLGELDADQGKAVLIELLLPPRQAGSYRIAQAQVSYDLPLHNQLGLESREDIIVGFTGDAQLARQYDPAVMNLVEKVTAYKLQTRALDEARMGNVAGATQKLRAAATRLLELGETGLAQAASEEADNLEKSGQMTSAGTKKLRYQTRKLTQKLPDLPDDH